MKRRLDPVTALGALLILVAGTALTTYLAIVLPSRFYAAQGPPEAFIQAATQQAAQQERPSPSAQFAVETRGPAPTPTLVPTSTPGGPATSTPARVVNAQADFPAAQATQNQFGDWPLPNYVETTYWLSIPAIDLEAPIITLTPREREVNGQTVLRLPVPNSYAAAWDGRSAQPGFTGNTIITGHNNFYGGVFQDLEALGFGSEVAIWTELGVFSYFISQIEYIPEDDQPLEVRYDNAHWLNQTTDDRVTLITCWPLENADHRLILVATR